MTSESFLKFQTGDTAKAGTDADVRIQLIGYNRKAFKNLLGHFSKPDVPTGSIFLNKKSETKATKLDNFFRDDFERGKTDKFIVNMKDIGDPLLCKLGKLIKSGSSG